MEKEIEMIKTLNKPIVIDDACDFCANIISSWHLSVLYAYLLKIQHELNRKIQGVVLISAQNLSGQSIIRISNEMLKHLDEITIQYYINNKNIGQENNKVSTFCKLLQNFNNTKKELFLITPLKYSFSWGRYFQFPDSRKLKFTKIDEGLGTYQYSPIYGWYFFKNQSNLKVFLSTIFQNFLYSTTIFLLKLKKIKFQSFFLFDWKKSVLIPNTDVSTYLKKVLIPEHLNNSAYEQNSILIIKDFDVNILDTKDSINLFQQLVDVIKKYTNKTIYIKRHPNDLNAEFKEYFLKYENNVTIIDSKTCVEEFYEKLKPSLLLAGVSTSAYTITSIFNVPVINYSLLYHKYNILNKHFDDLMIKKNYKCFRSLKSVCFIKSLEQKNFLEVLNEICDKEK